MDQHVETSSSDYVKGFIASLILTVIPFYLFGRNHYQIQRPMRFYLDVH